MPMHYQHEQGSNFVELCHWTDFLVYLMSSDNLQCGKYIATEHILLAGRNISL